MISCNKHSENGDNCVALVPAWRRRSHGLRASVSRIAMLLRVIRHLTVRSDKTLRLWSRTYGAYARKPRRCAV